MNAIDITNPLVLELRHLRGGLGEMVAALRRQAEVLRVRQITPPADIFNLVSQAETLIAALESTISVDAREIAQLRALAKTSALINSTLDVDTVLAQAMDEIIDLVNAERGFILLLNDDGTFDFRIARGADDDSGLPFAVGSQLPDVSRTIIRQVLANGQPILSDNASLDPRLEGIETVARFVLRSIMCVPLMMRGRVDGAIYVDNKLREGAFTPRELNVLSAFASQAAVAAENALLYQQVQATLREISQARALIENVFASLASGIVTTGAYDQVTTFNQAAGDILNTPPEVVIGQPVAEAMPPLTDGFTEQVAAVRQTERSLSVETTPSIPGRGTIALTLRMSPLKDGSGSTQGVAMVLDDRTEQHERDEMLGLIKRYLPPGMVDNITEIAGLALGGERREMTCVFVSVCQMTDLPHDLRPSQRMERLNRYLQCATDCVYAARGIIDKYLGNEIMVLFNTQLNPDPLHPLHAVEMALHMREAFLGLYEELGIEGTAHQYTIGIHTGVATMGNVGGMNRRSFTAIGDTINLAKRIQESFQPGQIVVSGSTVAHIEAHAPPEAYAGIGFVEREPMLARGRQQQTRIFEVHRVR
jgi:class 3 adenylate cyclase